MIGFLYRYRVILFYLAVILLVYVNRKKFDMHGLIALYRTKVGLKLMDRMASKYREIIKLLGYVGIGVGYVGVIAITYMLVKNLVDVVMMPGAPAAVAPVIPGVRIPGTALTVPVIIGWLALFVVVLAHEFAHGVVARAHKLPIKSSGIFFLGPLMGAFVEPNEKKLRKTSDVTQYSILAAGPFSNMLLAVAAVIVMNLVLAPMAGAMVTEKGFELEEVIEGYPAEGAGLEAGMVITQINSEDVKDAVMFTESLYGLKPGEELNVVADSRDYSFVAGEHPQDPSKGYLGVSGNTFEVLNNPAFGSLYAVVRWLITLVMWVAILSFGIGLINLFPIFITDGARMLQVTMARVSGEVKGLLLWKRINVFCLMVLLLGLMLPLIRWMF